MFRFIVALLWVIIFLIISIPFIIILFFIGLFAPAFKARVSQFFITTAFKLVTKISGAKVTVKGLENVPKDTAVLYIPNHRSIFDIILTYPLCSRQTAYIAKKETKKIPVFNIWMTFMNCQFLDRKDLRAGLKVVLNCVEFIKKGISVCVFPEGTRNKGEDDLLPFHDGSLKIADKAGCPIIPIAINNTENIFEAHFPKLAPAKVTLEYCAPIYPSDFTKENKRKISSAVQEEILEAYRRNEQDTV